MQEKDKNEINYQERTSELLKEILEEMKKASKFNHAYTYVTFAMTVITIMIAFFAVAFSFDGISIDLKDHLFKIIIMAGSIVWLLYWMFKGKGWDV